MSTELEGVDLDRAVADALGLRVVNLNRGRDGVYSGNAGCRLEDFVGYLQDIGVPRWAPSLYWDIGGPIIEQEQIDLDYMRGRSEHLRWRALCGKERIDGFGPTALVAAMRAYVRHAAAMLSLIHI